VKLLIVDDASAVYRRLIELLGGVERLTALSVARSLGEAVIKCRELRPDAVVMDIDLPDGNGLDAIQSIKSLCPKARVLVFSNRVEYSGKAIEQGADRFYDKSLQFEGLITHLLFTAPAPGVVPPGLANHGARL
jgi:DNA-binding NarL/FixJ family response regulator